MMFPSKNNKILNLKSINQNILNAKYAVRGELAIRADQITRVKEKKRIRTAYTESGLFRNWKRVQSSLLKKSHFVI